MKQFFRDYFTFNKRERNGIFILLSIITILIIYLSISDRFLQKDKVDFSKFEKEIETFQLATQPTADSLNRHNKSDKQFQIAEENKINGTIERFNFNPNGLPEADWKRLGLSSKQIKTIKNYESKGGKFLKKEDVKKMYCIPESLYLSLESFIQIPPLIAKLPLDNKQIVKNENSPLELNAADSSQLIKIKGIGAFYAKAIIKYRNSIGGFFSKEQLMEVWKLDKEKYDEIEKFLTVDSEKIKKININTANASELKHPYIKWNSVNAIINYRLNHGKYKHLEDILDQDLIDELSYEMISPYLTLE